MHSVFCSLGVLSSPHTRIPDNQHHKLHESNQQFSGTIGELCGQPGPFAAYAFTLSLRTRNSTAGAGGSEEASVIGDFSIRSKRTCRAKRLSELIHS